MFGLCSEDGIYISFMDLQSYTAQDSLCTRELNQWFVKQFDTVSAADVHGFDFLHLFDVVD
jgi:hypothetical protein